LAHQYRKHLIGFTQHRYACFLPTGKVGDDLNAARISGLTAEDSGFEVDPLHPIGNATEKHPIAALRAQLQESHAELSVPERLIAA
jgi:hypothetical protein